jgi:flagellar export protein FliJ
MANNMNTTAIARPCWSVLASKAEEKIASLHVEIAQARQRLESLESSRQRVQAMYDDYRLNLNSSQTESHGMREAMNHRQFMAQLLTLMQRVTTDIQHTQNLLSSYKERLLEFEKERIKMQALADQNALAVQKSLRRKEQSQMDSIGVIQFNLRPQN